MTDRPDAPARDDAANPYAAPAATTGQPWGTGDPECEAIRRANLTDEAYLKALVRGNLVFAAFFGWCAIYHLSFPVRNAIGQISAPWATKPNWTVFYALEAAIPVLGILGAYGLARRKPWAIFVQMLLVLDLLIFWVFPCINRDEPTPVLQFVFGAVFALFLITPFLNVLDLRDSVVFGSDHLRVIDATSYIRVKPKFPLSLRLFMVALGLFLLGLGFYITSV
jgi:hypothetical protein